MQIRPSMIMAPLLAAIFVSPVVQAIGDTFPNATVTATAGWPRTELVVLPAPVGHRQPTLDDLPPWLREQEKPGTQASPTPDAGQRRMTPDDRVPKICEPC